jgi:uncharacterized repeat protein (TIGR03803 family)
MARSGNLYGTTWVGGLGSGCNSDGCGTVFELVHPSGTRTAWTERILYVFTGGSDGGEPYGGVALDKKGNLYGTTGYGGNQIGDGTVFELSRLGEGKWIETVLHAFDRNTEGFRPVAGVVLDKSGNIFSTTSFSNAFELSPPKQPGDPWTETILYTFVSSDPSNLLLSRWGDAAYGTFGGMGMGGVNTARYSRSSRTEGGSLAVPPMRK